VFGVAGGFVSKANSFADKLDFDRVFNSSVLGGFS